MNRIRRQHATETMAYTVIWLLIAGLMTLDMVQGQASMERPLFEWWMLVRLARRLIPFFILFVISNSFLIPRLLLRNRITLYLACTIVALLLLWAYQYVEFFSHDPGFGPTDPILNSPGNFRHRHPRPLLPLPLFLDFTYGLLVVGGNLAVALLFQRFDDRLERESMQKANAENALAYLKAQINPHFYMNMLNNIHAMIEIDQEKAQEMVIDMSRLMRYMLYDSSLPMTQLANEVEFTENYLRLMRLRYPENRVDITANFPDKSDMTGLQVPPLLMLVFIENAFKHGISYRERSFISVSLEISGDRLEFRIVNSRRPHESEDNDKTGIGLANVRQRLELIFGSSADLQIRELEKEYIVNLAIPLHEVKNIDNR